MSEISEIIQKLTLINYKFNAEENIFTSSTDDVHQVIELVNINVELDKYNIDYKIDQYNNIHLNISE